MFGGDPGLAQRVRLQNRDTTLLSAAEASGVPVEEIREKVVKGGQVFIYSRNG